MKIKITWLVGALLLIFGLFFIACEGPDQPTYDADNPDPNPTGKDPATITALNPTTGYFSEVVTITGQDFDPVLTNNQVRFGSKFGTITNATATELTVLTPGIIGEEVDVEVAITGSEFWSNPIQFAFKPLPEIDTLEVIDEEISWPNGIAVDTEENVYIASVNDEIIYKITPEGTKSEFVSIPLSGHMHFGPDGYLYVCQQWEGKIVRVSADGSTVEDVVEVSDGDGPIDFDWDANGDMYIISNWAGVYKYDGSTVTEVASLGSPKCVRVFNGSLYVSDVWEGTIWRFDITDGGLENQEAMIQSSSISTFEVASNGLIIFAFAWETSLYTLFSDGSQGPLLYEEEMMTPMRYMVWHDKSIYVVYPGWGDVGMAMKAYIGLEQAPRYGPQ
jgi:sugar lactone lactonase YvrE